MRQGRVNIINNITTEKNVKEREHITLHIVETITNSMASIRQIANIIKMSVLGEYRYIRVTFCNSSYKRIITWKCCPHCEVATRAGCFLCFKFHEAVEQTVDLYKTPCFWTTEILHDSYQTKIYLVFPMNALIKHKSSVQTSQTIALEIVFIGDINSANW